MNLQALTIEQKQSFVALQPVLDARYQALRTLLLEAAEEKDIELWKINLALTDLESVLEVLLPRVPEDEEF